MPVNKDRRGDADLEKAQYPALPIFVIPGQVPRQTQPAALEALTGMPKAIDMATERLAFTDPVLRVEGITKGLPMEATVAKAFEKFVSSQLQKASNEAEFRMGLFRHLHYDMKEGDPTLRRALVQRSLAFYKSKGTSPRQQVVDRAARGFRMEKGALATHSEGSRGGHVIGHTSSGKPIYERKLTAAQLRETLANGHYSVISAGRNPEHPEEKHLPAHHEQFKQRHEALRGDLEQRGMPYTEVEGHYGGAEPSFIVHHRDGGKADGKAFLVHHTDKTEHAVIRDLGKKHRQDSVIHSKGGVHEMHYTTGPLKGMFIGGDGHEMTPLAEDFYTEVPHDGARASRFSLNFTWDKTRPFVEALHKGAPQQQLFVGPKGGKYSDAAHKHAWTDPWKDAWHEGQAKPRPVKALGEGDPSPKLKRSEALAGNLGIDRLEMPQIPSKALPAFLDETRASGIRVTGRTVPASALRATQSELHRADVEKNFRRQTQLEKPLVVSGDGFILDGHHRWAAIRALDPHGAVNVVEVGLPIRALLKHAHAFSGVAYKKALKEAYMQYMIKSGGEGSRGGKIVGHTSSGKPIYENANHPSHASFSRGDHDEAASAHLKHLKPGMTKEQSTPIIEAANAHVKLAYPHAPEPSWEGAGSVKLDFKNETNNSTKPGHVGETKRGLKVLAAKGHPHLGSEADNHYAQGPKGLEHHPFTRETAHWTTQDHKDAAKILRGQGNTADRHLANAHVAAASEKESHGGTLGPVIDHLDKVQRNLDKSLSAGDDAATASNLVVKAEPRGGSYHRRVTDPDSGKHKYFYKEEDYVKRPDAHVSGAEAKKARAKRHIMEHVGEKGASVDSLRALTDRYDSGMITDLVKQCCAAGELEHNNGHLKRVVEAKGLKVESTKPALDAVKKSSSGEGSRGGKIIGHTSSGKPLYASNGKPQHEANPHLSHADHAEIASNAQKFAQKHAPDGAEPHEAKHASATKVAAAHNAAAKMKGHDPSNALVAAHAKLLASRALQRPDPATALKVGKMIHSATERSTPEEHKAAADWHRAEAYRSRDNKSGKHPAGWHSARRDMRAKLHGLMAEQHESKAGVTKSGLHGWLDDVLEKSRVVGHKYISRTPKRGGKGWDYVYAPGQGPQQRGRAAEEPAHPFREIEGKQVFDQRPTRGKVSDARAKGGARNWVDHHPDHPTRASGGTASKYGINADTGVAHDAGRAKLHEEIIAKHFDHVPSVPRNKKPVAFVTMGGPASGKTSGLAILGIAGRSDFVHVDPDTVKTGDKHLGTTGLPEFHEGASLGFSAGGERVSSKSAASVVHDESSYIADRLRDKAIEARKNVVVDGTGKNAEKHIALIRRLKDEGYHVHLIMPHQTAQNAKRLNKIRSAKQGRHVPEDIVDEAYSKIPHNFHRIAAEADEAVLFNARDGFPPKKVWQKHVSGETTTHDAHFMHHFNGTFGGPPMQKSESDVPKKIKKDLPLSIPVEQLRKMVDDAFGAATHEGHEAESEHSYDDLHLDMSAKKAPKKETK